MQKYTIKIISEDDGGSSSFTIYMPKVVFYKLMHKIVGLWEPSVIK